MKKRIKIKHWILNSFDTLLKVGIIWTRISQVILFWKDDFFSETSSASQIISIF